MKDIEEPLTGWCRNGKVYISWVSISKFFAESLWAREYLYEALDYVEKGKVKVRTETFPLDDVADA